MSAVAVKKGPCPACGEEIINTGAHYEACPGRPVREDWTGKYQCPRCLDTSTRGGLCPCGARRHPTFRSAA